MENYGTIQGKDQEQPAEKGRKDDQLLQNGTEKISGKAWGRVKNIFARKKDYPTSIFFILATEFCERFSYYGMRTILVLYLTKWLLFDGDTATALYHGFVFLCYFSPLPGAIIADSYCGRYKTILFISMLYGVGNLVMAATAFPPPEWIGPVIGLVLIGIGTGGIKPCVSAFGGDQFGRGQEKETETFFSVFYFIINLGSLLSTFITPVLRADVNCYDNSCYPLAFGVPAVLMLVAIGLFICGTSMYKKNPPSGNMLGKVLRCTLYAIKRKFSPSSDSTEKKQHWLDNAKDKYEPEFVDDVKALGSVLFMYLPLPLFWALYEQQGSRWTLQAEKLDGNMGVFGTLKPEQLQVVNPLLIVLLIPVFERIIYPLIDKCRIPNRPLQRMSAGMIFAVIAFVVAGIIQIKLDTEMEEPLSPSESGVILVNTLPCDISVTKSEIFLNQLQDESGSSYIRQPNGNFTYKIDSYCQATPTSLITHAELLGGTSYRMFIIKENGKLNLAKFPDNRKKPKNGRALISIFLADAHNIGSVKLQSPGSNCSNEEGISINVTAQTASEFQLVDPDSYSICVEDKVTKWSSTNVTFDVGVGEAKTVILLHKNEEWSSFDVLSVSENTLSMLVLLPQYVVITIAEILFSITGLSFSYSQAPKSMKSLVQAMWLLTSGFGNIIVVIVAGIKSIRSQTFEFFLFAVLMGVDTLIFIIMSVFYKYNDFISSKYEDDDDTVGLVDNSPSSDGIPLKESKLD